MAQQQKDTTFARNLDGQLCKPCHVTQFHLLVFHIECFRRYDGMQGCLSKVEQHLTFLPSFKWELQLHFILMFHMCLLWRATVSVETS